MADLEQIISASVEAADNPEGPDTGATPEETQRKQTEKKLLAEINACKNYRKTLIPLWDTSIDYRRGKPFTTQSDEDRIFVPIDWMMTKSKHASLFSQIPQIRVDHFPQTVQSGPWVQKFASKLNDTIVTAGIEAAMDEVLPDCINAAGIGAVIVSHEALTELKDVPAIDLSTFPAELAEQIQQSGQMPDGSPLPMVQVPQVVDHRYTIDRISPADLLWTLGFAGSDFDRCPMLGRSGRLPWVRAKKAFGLKEEEKRAVLGDERRPTERLSYDPNEEQEDCKADVVEYDECFYKAFEYEDDPKKFAKIMRIVFVGGKKEPVVHEEWTGQQTTEDGQLIGALKNPIRILTLTYVTDDTIPPSDSAMGRMQVNELNRSRTNAMLQRQRSIPIRWANINRIDPTILQGMMRGTWQAVVPVQGDGSSILGEVTRAAIHPETYTFDTFIKSDIDDTWGIGPNQRGEFGQGRQSATEANVVEANFQTRLGRERAKVGKFVVSIAEVLGGLLALFETPDVFGEGFDPKICQTLAYSILADSTVLVDVNQRIQKAKDFIDFTAKSGYLNVEPVLREIASLSGFDPDVVIKAPEPAPPATPNVSIRFTGLEDLMNPMSLAFFLNSGQAPNAKQIEDAKKLIQLALQPSLSPDPQMGPNGQPLPPTPNSGPEVQPEVPAPPAPQVGDANPEWALMNTISSRSDGQEAGS